MKDVIISIRGNRIDPDLEEDVIELVTGGGYIYGEKESVLTYMESRLTGMEGTRTTLQVEPQIVTLTREGSVNSQMVFQKGRRHLFLYHTPYGSTVMGVDTRKIRSEFSETGGEMEISYVLDIDNTIIGENRFSVRFHQNKEKNAYMRTEGEKSNGKHDCGGEGAD